MSLRRRLRVLLSGPPEASGIDDLRDHVRLLEQHVHELGVAVAELKDRQIDEYERIRTQIGGAVDDLAERIAAIHARIVEPDAGRG